MYCLTAVDIGTPSTLTPFACRLTERLDDAGVDGRELSVTPAASHSTIGMVCAARKLRITSVAWSL